VQGHKDMIDNILYANSTRLNIKLLTLDNELKIFILERGLKNTLITPDELISSQGTPC
jgi:PIN domain nuclease of toxin-antitoxin system